MELGGEAEARVVVIGEGVDQNEALFMGSLQDAKEFVRTLSPGQQAEVAIVTEGRVYDPREI